MRIFLRIEGTQRAGAIAYFAFFSLFAAVILGVAVASIFFERDRASSEVIAFIESYIPIGAAAREQVFQTIAGIAKGRGPASLFAFALLGWSVMRFIAALIRAVNRAWSTDPPPWWRLSVKSLLFLLVVVAAVPLGMALPMLLRPLLEWFAPNLSVSGWIYSVGSFVVRFTVLFLALILFYRLAPRRRTQFAEVWLAAASATLLLIGAEALFRFYLGNVASLNAVYGAFGAVVALLMWVYLSGSIFIYGACLCAARDDVS
jgi:Ca2+-transporting ATPase